MRFALLSFLLLSACIPPPIFKPVDDCRSPDGIEVHLGPGWHMTCENVAGMLDAYVAAGASFYPASALRGVDVYVSSEGGIPCPAGACFGVTYFSGGDAQRIDISSHLCTILHEGYHVALGPSSSDHHGWAVSGFQDREASACGWRPDY